MGSDTVVQEKERAARTGAFRHDALLCEGIEDFVAQTSAFVRDSVRASEPIFVAVTGDKLRLLREELGGDADGVRFADIVQIGQNPARLIPAWRDFVAEHQHSGSFRGLGEPIWPSRSSEELVEAERHEALLNLAFNDAPPWWLVCPYDTASLPPAVVDEARRNHPVVVEDGVRRASAAFRGLEAVARPFDEPLPEPPSDLHEELLFSAGSSPLDAVRDRVARAASVFGLDPARGDDLVLVANEVATNSMRHGGGSGVLRLWQDGDSLICEIRDAGRIADPLVGRRQPSPDQVSGFGLWLAHQLCDLVQIRSFTTGSVVRLHVRR